MKATPVSPATKNEEYARSQGVILGRQYQFKDPRLGKITVTPFDGERDLGQMGLSQGFIHFREEGTEKVFHSGISYFVRHVTLVEGPKTPAS